MPAKGRPAHIDELANILEKTILELRKYPDGQICGVAVAVVGKDGLFKENQPLSGVWAQDFKTANELRDAVSTLATDVEIVRMAKADG